MSHEVLLDRLFRGESLSFEEGQELRLALRWRPWWPFLDVVADHLRTGKPMDWPADYPDSAARCAEAATVLRPLFEAWRTR